ASGHWPSAKAAVQLHPVPATPREGAASAHPPPRRGGEPVLRGNGSAPGAATATLTSPARGSARAARGGAGLEVDLADPRRVDALPGELRPVLPARGVVN